MESVTSYVTHYLRQRGWTTVEGFDDLWLAPFGKDSKSPRYDLHEALSVQAHEDRQSRTEVFIQSRGEAERLDRARGYADQLIGNLGLVNAHLLRNCTCACMTDCLRNMHSLVVEALTLEGRDFWR